jgi:hypothetical protein
MPQLLLVAVREEARDLARLVQEPHRVQERLGLFPIEPLDGCEEVPASPGCPVGVRCTSANNGLRGALRRHLGERFHADAYARWAAGEVFEEVARTCGVSARQVHRRAVAERWKERLEATQRKAAMLAVDQDAERLTRMALRHRKGARSIQRYAQGLLSGGTVVLDSQTNKPYILTAKDDTPVGFEFRPLLPAELAQAAQAFAKMATWSTAGRAARRRRPRPSTASPTCWLCSTRCGPSGGSPSLSARARRRRTTTGRRRTPTRG